MRTLPAQLAAAVRALLVFTVLLGLVYPLALTGVAQAVFHGNANGSLVRYDGRVVGSDLIGQQFSDTKGNPLPQWFQPRPSNAGDGYDPTATAAGNRGPEDTVDTPDRESLLTQVCTRSKDVAAADRVNADRPGCTPGFTGTPAVPADAVTASGSGIDPHISPAYAEQQARRVATARGLPLEQVLSLVRQHEQGRTLGFLGEPRVNVLLLNLALAKLDPGH